VVYFLPINVRVGSYAARIYLRQLRRACAVAQKKTSRRFAAHSFGTAQYRIAKSSSHVPMMAAISA
jgi:hypothetical protein